MRLAVKPVPGLACEECWFAYVGEHADWCSKTTMTACAVCGRMFYTDRGTGRCPQDDAAHRAHNTEKAA